MATEKDSGYRTLMDRLTSEDTDLARYRKLFDDTGVQYEVDHVDLNASSTHSHLVLGDVKTIVRTGSGIGYSGFTCVFHFDVFGKMLKYGVWE